MKADEEAIVAEAAAKQSLIEPATVFRRFSPANKVVPLAILGIVVVGLWGIYAFSSTTSTTNQVNRDEQILMARLMPKEEVTPNYIDTIGGKKESKNDEAELEAKRAKEEKADTAPRPPTNVGSMMIFTSSGGAGGAFGSLGLPLGSELRAVLEKNVVADDQAVPVIARLLDDFRKDGQVVVPRNSRLFGSTQGMMENRVEVRFSKLVMPDGKEYAFSGIAMDAAGGGGVQGDLKRKWGARGRNVVGNAILGAAGIFAPMGGSFADTAVRGAQGGATNELFNDSQYHRRTKATPVVTLKALTRITVLVDRAA